MRVAEGIDPFPLLQRLAGREDLWNADPMRTTFEGSPHVQADDILMRFDDGTAEEIIAKADTDIGTRSWRPAWEMLPEARGMIVGLMARVGAYSLERVLITRLKPGAEILPHADVRGAYANLPDIARYHVVLQGLPGSLFHCGGETVCMETGSAWWFNAHQVHAVQNGSTEDRLHMLVDVRLFQ